MHCNTTQRTATQCNALQHTHDAFRALFCTSWQDTIITHRNALQHNATHCNTTQRTATHSRCIPYTLYLLAAHYNALPHNATHSLTHWNTLQHDATHTTKHTAHICTSWPESLQNQWQRCIPNNTATHCNILQHTATHCNTLQHTATHTE